MGHQSRRQKKPNHDSGGKDKGAKKDTPPTPLSTTTTKQRIKDGKTPAPALAKKVKTSSKNTMPMVRKVIACASIVLNFVAAYFLFVPRVIPSIVMPQNTNFPFEIFLNITNSGCSDISDVEPITDDLKYTSSASQPLTMYTLDPEGRLAGEKPPPIEYIKPNHSEVVDLRKMFGLLAGRTEKASFSVTIKYNVWYYPFKLTQKHYYKLYRTVTGVYAWQEISHKESE